MTSLATLGLALSILQAGPDRPELVDVRKISDRANHSAFTDLLRFRDRWFLCFREGAGHAVLRGTRRHAGRYRAYGLARRGFRRRGG